jgi:galactitol PTS system EIIA component
MERRNIVAESIRNYLKKNLIINKLEAKTREDIFQASFKLLYSNNFVKQSFLEGLIEREKVFPTGLRIGKYNVAIPHTDAIHVLKPAISVMTLKDPVTFRCMDGSGQVDVNIVFTMALNKPHSQILMLQQLMNLIQDEKTMESILEKDDAESIYNLLNKIDIKIS